MTAITPITHGISDPVRLTQNQTVLTKVNNDKLEESISTQENSDKDSINGKKSDILLRKLAGINEEGLTEITSRQDSISGKSRSFLDFDDF